MRKVAIAIAALALGAAGVAAVGSARTGHDGVRLVAAQEAAGVSASVSGSVVVESEATASSVSTTMSASVPAVTLEAPASISVHASLSASVAGAGPSVATRQPVPAPPSFAPGPRPERRKAAPMFLSCWAFSHDGQHVAGCRWNRPGDPRVSGYQLWRASAQTMRPEAVFRTDDPARIWYLDREIAPGDYVYRVEALDAGGRVVAASQPVRVRVGGEGGPHRAPPGTWPGPEPPAA